MPESNTVEGEKSNSKCAIADFCGEKGETVTELIVCAVVKIGKKTLDHSRLT